MSWQPIRTAPTHKSVLLFTPYGLIYCGRRRYGHLGEPQQDEFAWRCDSSGRFADPTYWMHLPEPPADEDTRYELTDAGREALERGK